MGLFTIDQKKCRRDGICAAECPARLIEMNGENFPVAAVSAEKLCIHCGHCVAVCPEGALSMKTMTPQQCEPVGASVTISFERLAYLMRTRRSIRSFKKKPVDRRILESMIENAAYAPSIKNLQPVNWLVVQNASEVKRLASIVVDWFKSMLEGKTEARYPITALKQIASKWEEGDDLICHGAPHVLVVHGHKNSRASLSSCIIALTMVDLLAQSRGLGTCWGGYFYAAANFCSDMSDALAIPSGHLCFAAMMIGHPRYSYYRIPLRKKPVISWR